VTRKDDLLERVEKALRSDFERRSFQGTKNIEEHLRIAGYEDVFHEVAVKAHLNEDALRGDKLYVGVSPAPSAWFGLPDDVSKWIHANQK